MSKSILIFLAAAIQSVHAFPIQPEKGKTEFLAVGRPSALKINGKGSGPSGELKFSKAGADDMLLDGEVDMDLSSFDTGIGMRDRHMKEKYLEVEKFKTAKLKFQGVKIPKSVLESGGSLNVPAMLSLHGIEKPVEVVISLNAKGETLISSSKFKLKLTDYAIEVPKFSGITVADEVEVTAQTEVARASFKEEL